MKNKTRLLFALTLMTILLIKCGSGAEISEKELNETEKSSQIITMVENSTIDSLNINASEKEWLKNFYKLVNNNSVWVEQENLSDSILEFLNYLNSDVALNIPIGYLSNQTFQYNEKAINKEIKGILRCAEFLSLKDTTLINYSNNKLNRLKVISPEEFIEFLKHKDDSTSWIEHLISYKENNSRFVQLHFALNRFTKKYGIENTTNENIYLKTPKDSLAFVFIQKQLIDRKFISDPTIDTSQLKAHLKSFQLLNGLNTDAKLGKNTMKALLETNYSRYIKGVITLDKMREFPDSLIGGKSIVINIPSYLLHLYNDDEVLNTSKVIIGTQRNPTPLFTAEMKYIVVSPYWNVPYSIASKEILPHLKTDSTYLKRNNYSILDRNKNVLIADSIDWKKYNSSNFPFFVRQEPGLKNSLGLVKLLFPNKHSIYIHDTPNKSLFSRDVRTFSHGCIRTESPFKLVHDILTTENHKYIDSLDVYKENKKETYLILSEKFPVTIVYQTAGINDSTKQVQFFNDVYKKEEELYKLFGEPTIEL